MRQRGQVDTVVNPWSGSNTTMQVVRWICSCFSSHNGMVRAGRSLWCLCLEKQKH